jgi:N-acylneuraminate cytidylyltransferase/CMP-N,N'-diacetyllegionaminic acid synthase
MLAIIPARGGSKGVPGKNIKNLVDKPLICYTIKAAKESKFIDRVIISTDDEEIAEVAKKYGAEVPFMRPNELATDTAKAIDTYLYTINRLNENSTNLIEEFIVLQPTSPLRSAIDIDTAIEIFKKNKADSVISVVEAEHPPYWYKKITNEGILKDYFISNNSLNRQEYDRTYLPNGAIFVFRYNILKETLNYYTDKTYPYVMPRDRSVDIDNFLDFKMAEFLISQE